MKKLRLGIIGYGFMGQWHNNHAGTLEEVEIVAICDTDPEKRAEAPENVKMYTDYKALLADSDVEWVMISVPNHLHHDIAIDAAKAKTGHPSPSILATPLKCCDPWAFNCCRCPLMITQTTRGIQDD